MAKKNYSEFYSEMSKVARLRRTFASKIIRFHDIAFFKETQKRLQTIYYLVSQMYAVIEKYPDTRLLLVF